MRPKRDAIEIMQCRPSGQMSTYLLYFQWYMRCYLGYLVVDWLGFGECVHLDGYGDAHVLCLPSMGMRRQRFLSFSVSRECHSNIQQYCMRLIVSLSIKPEPDEKKWKFVSSGRNESYSLFFRLVHLLFSVGGEANAIWFVREIYGTYLSFFTTMDHPIYCQWTLIVLGMTTKTAQHRWTNSKSHIARIPYSSLLILFCCLFRFHRNWTSNAIWFQFEIYHIKMTSPAAFIELNFPTAYTFDVNIVARAADIETIVLKKTNEPNQARTRPTLVRRRVCMRAILRFK